MNRIKTLPAHPAGAPTTFGSYLRLDGLAGITVGAALFALGTVQGRQGHLDALIGGVVMLAMTGASMKLRRGVALGDLGGWFTARPLSAAAGDAGDGHPGRRRNLLIRAIAGTLGLAALTLLLSHLTGYWLTYMDLGVWLVVTGLIKVGPAVGVVAAHESATQCTYWVSKKTLRGQLALVTSGLAHAPWTRTGREGPLAVTAWSTIEPNAIGALATDGLSGVGSHP